MNSSFYDDPLCGWKGSFVLYWFASFWSTWQYGGETGDADRRAAEYVSRLMQGKLCISPQPFFEIIHENLSIKGHCMEAEPLELSSTLVRLARSRWAPLAREPYDQDLLNAVEPATGVRLEDAIPEHQVRLSARQSLHISWSYLFQVIFSHFFTSACTAMSSLAHSITGIDDASQSATSSCVFW